MKLFLMSCSNCITDAANGYCSDGQLQQPILCQVLSGLSLKTKDPICVMPLMTALVLCSMGWEASFCAICFVNLE